MTRPTLPSQNDQAALNLQQVQHQEVTRVTRAAERSTLPAVRACSLDFGDR